ncbi:MAG: phenylalanine--tRNA ligase subunit beta, partial [Deltaproteobacteria bacterium]|nr:phenylalanine--tRNA ligase subunit beta [Deltaproteobacteria bacterium]
ETGPAVETLAAVTIEDPAGCPRYSARVIQGVRIGPSPDWLQRRLQAVGVRPINNVVDATNYALMERGQPLHAFDFDRLEGRRIVVRRARPGEEFYTLDGQRRVLSGEALMICDAARAVALAGIMGGANSEIAPDTTAVLLESAYFDPITTRRTSKALGLRTEASQRFERGADPAGIVPALDRGAALICELAGGEIARGVVDVYPRPIVPRELRLRPGRVNALLGTALPAEEVRALLERLQLGTRPAGDGELRVTVPTFRPDLQEEVDLIEEVARLHGYQRIPEALPQGTAGPEPRDRGQLLRERVQTLLTGAGLHEAITFSFHAPRVFDQLCLAPDDPRRRCVRLLNPLSETQSVMRTLLVPGLLEAAGRNANRKNPTVRLFEVGKVFLPTVDGKLPQEVWTLGLLLMGLRQDELWDRERAALDFYDLKGTIELLLDGLDVRAVSARATEAIPYLHPGKAAELLAEGEVMGLLGEVHPEVLGAFDLKSPALVAEVNLEALAAHVSPRKGFTPLPRFPAVFRDFALVADEGLEAEAVCRAVLAGRDPLLQEVRPFDVYRGDPIPPGKKGMAFRIRYQAQDRTLTDEEVNGIHEQALARLRGELGAEIRQ